MNNEKKANAEILNEFSRKPANELRGFLLESSKKWKPRRLVAGFQLAHCLLKNRKLKTLFSGFVPSKAKEMWKRRNLLIMV